MDEAEAVIALGILNNIDPGLLSRVFLINGSNDNFIRAKKPLAISGELKEWFETQAKLGKLISGSEFKVDNETYLVDDFGALRSTNLPTVYLDAEPAAYWGVGHVAPMVGDFIIDPAVANEPIHYWDWKEEIETENVLPIRAQVNSLPDIDFNLLDIEEVKNVMKVIDQNFALGNYNNHELINLASTKYQQLSDSQKVHIFFELFKEQIENNSLLPKNMWSELSITPLTTRGERFGEVSQINRNQLNHKLTNLAWENRLELAINAMRPFKAFENLIKGSSFSWKNPNS